MASAIPPSLPRQTRYTPAMARRKLIPDAAVCTEIHRLLAEGGERAVSFSAVAQATGLAGPTLVQRFGAREEMLRLALAAAWDRLEAETRSAETLAPLNAKGAQALLKALDTLDVALLAADFRDETLRARAESWRAQVETALALRLGGGAQGREAAAILFAAWQGQILWQTAGGKGFRLKEALKRLTS